MPTDTPLHGATPSLVSSWSQGRLGRLIEQLLDLAMPDQQWDSSRRRATLIAMDRLFRNERPLHGIGGAPPSQSKGGPLLAPDSPVLFAAMTSLAQFGITCMNLREFVESDQYMDKVWQHLGHYIPRVLDWITYLHPMYGNVRPAADTQDHSMLCNAVVVALKGVCTPALFGGVDNMRNYLLTTSTLLLTVDFWVNIFRYARHFGPEDTTVLYSLETFFQFAFEGILPLDDDAQFMPHVVAHTVQQRVGRDVRGLYRTIARYVSLTSTVDNTTRINKAQPYNYQIGDIYSIAEGLLNFPGLQPLVCPREAVRTLVQTIKEHSDKHIWRASGTGIVYLADLWNHTGDNRIIAWSLNDGFFDAFLRVTADCPPQIDGALDLAGSFIRNGLSCWRVMHAFHRAVASRLPALHALARKKPILAAIMIAYETRIAVHQRARKEWKARKSQCSHAQCSGSTDSTAKQEIRACVCGDAWYCSVECQKKHWSAGHCEECLPLDTISVSPRDRHYIALLVQEYLDANASSINADVLEFKADSNVLQADADVLKADSNVLNTDPRYDHRFSVVVDLQQPMISHRVVKPDEVSARTLGDVEVGKLKKSSIDDPEGSAIDDVEEAAIDDGISGAVYACYIERERARQERVRLLSGSGSMVYVV